MIFLWLTRGEAEYLRGRVEAGQDALALKVDQQIAFDVIRCDDAPKLVILRDGGDGLEPVATVYQDGGAADRAFDRAFALLQKDGGL